MCLGVALAALKIDLWILITTFGVFRLLAVAPTLYALFSNRIISVNTVFWSMLLTGVFGLYATVSKLPLEKLNLSLIMIAIPACALLYEHLKAKYVE